MPTDAIGTFPILPPLERVSLAGIVIEGNAEAAGGQNEINVHIENLPCAESGREVPDQTLPLRITRVNEPGAPISTEDQRLLRERALHQRHPRGVREVRPRLVLSSC